MKYHGIDTECSSLVVTEEQDPVPHSIQAARVGFVIGPGCFAPRYREWDARRRVVLTGQGFCAFCPLVLPLQCPATCKVAVVPLGPPTQIGRTDRHAMTICKLHLICCCFEPEHPEIVDAFSDYLEMQWRNARSAHVSIDAEEARYEREKAAGHFDGNPKRRGLGQHRRRTLTAKPIMATCMCPRCNSSLMQDRSRTCRKCAGAIRHLPPLEQAAEIAKYESARTDRLKQLGKKPKKYDYVPRRDPW